MSQPSKFESLFLLWHWVIGALLLAAGLIGAGWKAIAVGATCWAFNGLITIADAIEHREGKL